VGANNIKQQLDEVFNELLAPALATGIPDAGIPSLDPYTQDFSESSIELLSGEGTFLKFSFVNVSMSGYSQAVLNSYDSYHSVLDGPTAYEVDRSLTIVHPYLNANYILKGRLNYNQRFNATGTVNITATSMTRDSNIIITQHTNRTTGSVHYTGFDSYEFCSSISGAVMNWTGLPSEVLSELDYDYGYNLQTIFCGAIMSYVNNAIGEMEVITTLLDENQQ
jgi:hypothetical protein